MVERWRFVFGITAGISLLGAIAFVVGGSAKEIEGLTSTKYRTIPSKNGEELSLISQTDTTSYSKAMENN